MPHDIRCVGKPAQAYTHIVSLGRDCRPSYQIARHFKFKQSYPFDGWFTPLDSLALYIERLEDDLYEAASLQERAKKDSQPLTIVNVNFGIQLFHDFERSGVPPSDVIPDWKSGLDRARSRTAYLVHKLQSLNRVSNHVLFVRLFDKVSKQSLFGKRLTPLQATERLLKALRTRFDQISFDLMCISFKHHLADPNVIYVDMRDTATNWQGTDSLWSQAFDQIGARLEPSQVPSTGA
jgi:hypothetical protein